jgi:hypothetical protein
LKRCGSYLKSSLLSVDSQFESEIKDNVLRCCVKMDLYYFVNVLASVFGSEMLWLMLWSRLNYRLIFQFESVIKVNTFLKDLCTVVIDRFMVSCSCRWNVYGLCLKSFIIG